MTKVNKIGSLTWRLILANIQITHTCTHTHTQIQNQCLGPTPNRLNLNLWGAGLHMEGLQSSPGDSDEQPGFRQMKTLLELDE